MTNEELKTRIGSNIARLRKKNRMTQAELAEKLNYSDKAVSKWERAESMPDVLTLMLLAELFDTDVNELLSDPDRAPEEPQPEPQPSPAPEKPKRETTISPTEKLREELRQKLPDVNKSTIQKLASILVWVVALFIFLVLDSFALPYCWLIFVVAVMANAIVLLSLRSAWKLYGINRILVSVIMWTALVFLYLVLLFSTGVHVWRIFLMGLVGQAAILLWFRIFRYPEEKKEDDHE